MTRLRSSTRWIATMGLAGGLVFGLAACEPPDALEEPVAEVTAPEMVAAAAPVTITATEYEFDAPASIPGGMTEIEFVNAGEQAHGLVLVQLLDGRTTDDLVAMLSQEEVDIPDWVVLPGGINGIDGGQSATAFLDLPPGQYAIFSFESAPGGETPDFAQGMIQELEVTEVAEVQALAPKADLTIELAEFSFIPSKPIQAGEQMVEVRNSGAQTHEALVMRLVEGMTAEKLVEMMTQGPPEEGAEMAAEGTPDAGATAVDEETADATDSEEEAPPEGPPFTSAGGMTPIVPGRTGFVSLNLTPGNYVLICFIPDPADGAPHLVKGMIQEFTIE